MPRWKVMIARYGYVPVETEDEDDARYLAECQPLDKIDWMMGLEAVECEEDPTLTSEECVKPDWEEWL